MKSIIENTVVFGMMNIGFRPTINGKNQTIEIHFFNYNNDLYGKELTVELLYFLRDEQKFSSVEKLTLQLKKDKETSLTYINKN